MSFLDRLNACRVFDPLGYIPFRVDGAPVGLVRPHFAERLAGFSDVFVVSPTAVDLHPHLETPDQRTAAVDTVLRALHAQGAIAGWRDEPYTVTASPEGQELFRIERAAVPLFGFWVTGVHVNGIVHTVGGLHLWVGRRSPLKQMSPNKLDQIVAGGRSANHSVIETMLKESDEEAGIPEQLARTARPAGVISYCTERPEGLRRDILYVYDLELPASFQPVNQDGEIVEFQLWPVERVAETVRDTDAFKFNCALVVIDLLVRYGLMAPEEPDYLALVHGMRTPLLAFPAQAKTL